MGMMGLPNLPSAICSPPGSQEKKNNQCEAVGGDASKKKHDHIFLS